MSGDQLLHSLQFFFFFWGLDNSFYLKWHFTKANAMTLSINLKVKFKVKGTENRKRGIRNLNKKLLYYLFSTLIQWQCLLPDLTHFCFMTSQKVLTNISNRSLKVCISCWGAKKSTSYCGKVFFLIKHYVVLNFCLLTEVLNSPQFLMTWIPSFGLYTTFKALLSIFKPWPYYYKFLLDNFKIQGYPWNIVGFLLENFNCKKKIIRLNFNIGEKKHFFSHAWYIWFVFWFKYLFF